MGELKVDVPGVTEDDLDIKIDDDGRLTIEGQRMVSSETSRYTSKFSKTYSLDKTVDVDKFTASLNNGVLVVSAPKDLAKLEENIRRIPITASAVMLPLLMTNHRQKKPKIFRNTKKELKMKKLRSRPTTIHLIWMDRMQSK